MAQQNHRGRFPAKIIKPLNGQYKPLLDYKNRTVTHPELDENEKVASLILKQYKQGKDNTWEVQNSKYENIPGQEILNDLNIEKNGFRGFELNDPFINQLRKKQKLLLDELKTIERKSRIIKKPDKLKSKIIVKNKGSRKEPPEVSLSKSHVKKTIKNQQSKIINNKSNENNNAKLIQETEDNKSNNELNDNNIPDIPIIIKNRKSYKIDIPKPTQKIKQKKPKERLPKNFIKDLVDTLNGKKPPKKDHNLISNKSTEINVNPPHTSRKLLKPKRHVKEEAESQSKNLEAGKKVEKKSEKETTFKKEFKYVTYNLKDKEISKLAENGHYNSPSKKLTGLTDAIKSSDDSKNVPHKKLKTLHPDEDKQKTFKLLHGVRMKQVSYMSSIPPQYSRAKKQDLLEIPSTSLSGFTNHNNNKNQLIQTNGVKSTEEILQYRQAEAVNEEMINSLYPPGFVSTTELDQEEEGFPIIMNKRTDSLNLLLCFLCGSAGDSQLIFCSACYEPYHLFCTGEVFVYLGEDSNNENKTNEINISNKQDVIKKNSISWNCKKCKKCSICNENKRPEFIFKKLNEFVSCSACKISSAHLGCAFKINSKNKNEEFNFWLCEDCFKCKSCGVKMVSEQIQKKKNTQRFCSRCIKKMKKGSYCPICSCCYEDDDFDTPMVECAKCERWIHASCDQISGENYQILGLLPEDLEYHCKLCDTENMSIWRKAVKNEVLIGIRNVLIHFQQILTNLSLKKRNNLTPVPVSVSKIKIEIEEAKDSLNIDEPKNKVKRALFQNDENEEIEIKDEIEIKEEISQPQYSSFNLKPCTVVLEDYFGYDYDNSGFQEDKIKSIMLSRIRESETISITDSETLSSTLTPIKERKPFEDKTNEIDFIEKMDCTTPEKFEIKEEKLFSNPPTTPINTNTTLSINNQEIFTPSKKIIFDSLEENIEKFKSVFHFYSYAYQNFEKYSSDKERGALLKSIFEECIQQFFKWFDPKTHCEIFDEDDELINIKCFEGKIKKSKNITNTSYNLDLFEYVYSPKLHDSLDNRKCAFCSKVGDLPSENCGRLIWAGGEWVHVNCTLWSSEVYEEESGALKQVFSALHRSKFLICVVCKLKGASVSCCNSLCKNNYHFSCAKERKCIFTEEKELFCSTHIKSQNFSPDAILDDFRVYRKVFIDRELIKKKEKAMMSSDIMILIGALKIEKLGMLVPISSLKSGAESSDLLIPLSFKCSRFLPFANEIFEFETFISEWNWKFNKFETHFIPKYGLPNITVDHGEKEKLVNQKLKDVAEYHNWLKDAVRYYDEYKQEHLEPYPNCLEEFKKLLGQFNYDDKNYNVFGEEFKSKIESGNNKISSNISFRVTFKSELELESLNVEDIWDCLILNYNNGCYSNNLNLYKFLGFGIRLVKNIIEQLPGIESIDTKSHRFKFKSPTNKNIKEIKTGSSRTEGFISRKPVDMFGWLGSLARDGSLKRLRHKIQDQSQNTGNIGTSERNNRTQQNIQPNCRMNLPIAMSFRTLKDKEIYLQVLRSEIHGRGLFVMKDFEDKEMIIEYAGEVIRPSVSDLREKFYESKGIGCYFFKIDENDVVDATMMGNSARFINHSCEPNCESKCVKVLGKKHIIIYALRKILKGEELTYDYKFKFEDDDKKILCGCRAKKCKKYLN